MFSCSYSDSGAILTCETKSNKWCIIFLNIISVVQLKSIDKFSWHRNFRFYYLSCSIKNILKNVPGTELSWDRNFCFYFPRTETFVFIIPGTEPYWDRNFCFFPGTETSVFIIPGTEPSWDRNFRFYFPMVYHISKHNLSCSIKKYW